MKAIAIEKARAHLELAKEAIEGLNLENGKCAYEVAWSQFLSQVSRFYSKFEQGTKGCKKSEPWFGRKKHERKTDALLSYLHHARDSDEHGLDFVVQETGSRLEVRMAEGATEIHTSFDMMVDDLGQVHIRNPKTSTPQAVQTMDLVDPRMELVTVTDGRFGDSFDPPEMHLGKPIVDRSPSGIAKLTIPYLNDFLEEASELPQHS